MSGTIRQTLMTAEEFLALPDDGIERELIDGVIQEWSMTKWSRDHARVEASIAALLKNWVWSQAVPVGTVYSGEVGCLLKRNPDVVVGIDVALFSSDGEKTTPEGDSSSLMPSPPLLAVEILSPHDTQKRINEKIDLYLATGVGIVWIVNPHLRTIGVHTRGAEPRYFNVEDELPAHPLLPGLEIKVAKVFE